MLSSCLKCRKNTKRKDSRFIKELEASGLLSNLGLKRP